MPIGDILANYIAGVIGLGPRDKSGQSNSQRCAGPQLDDPGRTYVQPMAMRDDQVSQPYRVAITRGRALPLAASGQGIHPGYIRGSTEQDLSYHCPGVWPQGLRQGT